MVTSSVPGPAAISCADARCAPTMATAVMAIAIDRFMMTSCGAAYGKRRAGGLSAERRGFLRDRSGSGCAAASRVLIRAQRRRIGRRLQRASADVDRVFL